MQVEKAFVNWRVKKMSLILQLFCIHQQFKNMKHNKAVEAAIPSQQ